MAHHHQRSTASLRVEILEPRETPSSSPLLFEAFDATAVGALPANWSQLSSTSQSKFAVSTAQAFSTPVSLVVTSSASGANTRAWLNDAQPADAQVSTDLFLNSLIPAQLFLRGQDLETATPSYYAVSVTRAMKVQLLRVSGGVTTTLAQASAGFLNNHWLRVTLAAEGSGLRAQVFRFDTAQYLNAAGQWQAEPVWAVSATDGTLTAAGQVGLARPPSFTGMLTFDDFAVFPVEGDTGAPTVSVTAPAANATVGGVATVQATATDLLGVGKVEFYVDNVLRFTDLAAPYGWDFDTLIASNGPHTITVQAYDLAANVARESITVLTQNAGALPVPILPQHYSHIRLAQLAYGGTDFGPFEDGLLHNSVDLVVVERPTALQHIQAVAPDTTALLYSNASSLYGNLLPDWLNFADAHGLKREDAFFHVTAPTPMTGSSPAARPVNWFWGVYRDGPKPADLTIAARGLEEGPNVPFGGAGTSVHVGYLDKFREINVKMLVGASGPWSVSIEYPFLVRPDGTPMGWKPLPLLANTTDGMTHTGQILFDPPADWKPAKVGGSPRFYYVRFRTLTDGNAPVVSRLLGRNYVGAGAGNLGVIPAFDGAADANKDGYLNDAEYAGREPGKDARFFYESRAFAGFGPMRPATNPSNAGFRLWAVDYHRRLLQTNPLADGLFLDNSNGSPPQNLGSIQESLAGFTTNYANLLNAISKAVAPRWLLPNTVAGGAAATTVVQKSVAYFEEFLIRPLAHNFQQFEKAAAIVAQRVQLRAPSPYAVIDSTPDGGSPTDPRTQLATLAYYYLLSDPATTFLDVFGGVEPAGPWTNHFIPASTFDVGQPLATTWSLFATGTDPANAALTYRIYQRPFANALVLYKPLSGGSSVKPGLGDTTATTHALGGLFQPLNADGTLGAPTTSVTLRNGEGAILIKV